MNARPRVLVREEIAEAGVDLLRARFDVDTDSESDLASIIGGYDGIVIRSATKLTADLIEAGTNLKVIGRAGVGVDNVDVEAATRRGIVVANAPESNIVSAAEHTIGLLFALARNIPQAHAALREGRWERSKWGGIELAEKTLGVLGFGRIGQRVARRALGLQMNVVAYDPFVSAERFREAGVEQDTLEGVLARADFVTIHLPLNDETRGVIDAGAIALMKEGARLINAARGELVDEQALLEALQSGRLGGAAIDVFPQEPYSGPLLEAPNIVVTPHLAASTDEAQDRAGVIVAEQVAAALDGGLVTNAVNIPSVGAEDFEVLGPYLSLAASLGRFAVELARGEPGRLTLEYDGELAEHDTRLLTLAVLNGAFRGRVDQPVNYVNAPLIAAERGIEVVEQRRRSSRDFTNLIAVSAGDLRVAGTTIGRDNRQWLVSALGFDVEIELAPRMVVLRYDDVPGVIGRVGTLLGEAGINIANMAVSRNREAGKAVMVLSLDSPAEPEVLERLGHGADEVYFVELLSRTRAAPRAAARSRGTGELDQVLGGRADLPRPPGPPGFDPTTSSPTFAARRGRDRRAESARERLGGLERAGVAVLADGAIVGSRRRRGRRTRRRERERDGPPSSSRRAEACGSTWPGAVRYSEPNTITSACSSTASSRSPSGVEALRTTWRGTSGPEPPAPRFERASASCSASRSRPLLASCACRTYASSRVAPAPASRLPRASASRSLSVPS